MEKLRTSTQKRLNGIVYACLLVSVAAYGQSRTVDTARVYPLSEVIVSERYESHEVRAAAVIQVFSEKQLSRLNALQLSDAVKHFAGVTVKDYGGIGGLKTISLRSLGAEHTAVGYDGITLSNMQTGQIDISRFSLEGVAQLSLSNGQSDNIFQPARFFASAGVLNIQTATPDFAEGKAVNATGSLKTGSWGLLHPSASVDRKLNDRWALSANIDFTTADGGYPYLLHYGNEADSTSREKRKNTGVQTFKAETGIFGNSANGQWRLKAYYYQSSRGLPGAATLYYDYTSQHLWDKETFVQSHYKRELSQRWVFQTSAKWGGSYQRYLDPDYKGVEGKTENNYHHQEYYLSASLLYRMPSRLSFSLSTDGSINSMTADLRDFTRPARYSWLTVVAGKYVSERITATASLLSAFSNDETRSDDRRTVSHRRLTPYAGISFQPFKAEEWRIRASYKSIFRLPSFNDLYYTGAGSRSLLPENTAQYNLGITYQKPPNGLVTHLSITADAYYNKVSNKLIAIPTKNLFIWSVVNLGEVDIRGVDAATHLDLQPWRSVGINLSGSYTYQRALDVTNPDGKTYRHQLAYTPRVSGSAQAGITTPYLNLSYTLLFSGKRYALGQNSTQNRIDGYTDHSLSANRTLTFGKVKTSLTVEVLNLLNRNYEIIRYFPMPGRSLRFGLKAVY